MKQISIFEILEEKKPIREPCGRRCDVECYSLKCFLKRGYIRHDGKWCRNENGEIQISVNKDCDWIPKQFDFSGWQEIQTADIVKFDQYVPIHIPVNDVSFDAFWIDDIFQGTVNGIRAEIGCRRWCQRLGFTGTCDVYQPIQWRKENNKK